MSEYIEETKHKLRKVKLTRAKVEALELPNINLLDKYLLIVIPSDFPKEDLLVDEATLIRIQKDKYLTPATLNVYHIITNTQLYSLLEKDYLNTWLLTPAEFQISRTNETLKKVDKLLEALELYEEQQKNPFGSIKIPIKNPYIPPQPYTWPNTNFPWVTTTTGAYGGILTTTTSLGGSGTHKYAPTSSSGTTPPNLQQKFSGINNVLDSLAVDFNNDLINQLNQEIDAFGNK